MVLYVLLIVFGEVICFCGGFIFEFMLGYVKLKYEVNLQMILCCLLDEDLQNLVDLVYCCCCIIMQNMCDEELVIVQVEEMQVVFVVFKGKYIMIGEVFDLVEVDMGCSEENNIMQFGGTEWSKCDKFMYDLIDDIEVYVLNVSGVVNIIVFDLKGWVLFCFFKVVKEKLDICCGFNFELEIVVKDLGKVVFYKGMYGDVVIVVYFGQYVENGVKKNFLLDNMMVLGNIQVCGLCIYGCIQDVDVQCEGINVFVCYLKNWVIIGDLVCEFIMIQLVLLMLLVDFDEFVFV